MDKFYNVTKVQFIHDYLYFSIDNQSYKVRIGEVSAKLATANEQVRNDYKVSPSGYGIHWQQIDEDLSINGLLRMATSK